MATETGKFYFVASSGRKSVWTFVRQLRGPHFRTWAWYKRRSRSAVTAAVSLRSLPQSSTGRLDVRERGRPLVAAHDHLEEVLGGGVRELAHACVGTSVPRRRQRLGRQPWWPVFRCPLMAGFGCPPRPRSRINRRGTASARCTGSSLSDTRNASYRCMVSCRTSFVWDATCSEPFTTAC